MNDGRRAPYLGLRAAAPAYRWTGDAPDPAYMAQVAAACRTPRRSSQQESMLWRLLYGDVTGFAFTRAALERYYMLSGVSRTRKRRIAALLDSLPPWPFEPTPTGWSRDGFPEEMF